MAGAGDLSCSLPRPESELILQQSRSEAEAEACFPLRKVMAGTCNVQIENVG